MSDRPSQPPGSSPDPPAPGATSPAAPPRVHTTARRSSGLAASIVRGLANLFAAGVLVYLTYFFTMFFAHRTPPPTPVSEEARVATKEVEKLRAEERKLLSTYGG